VAGGDECAGFSDHIFNRLAPEARAKTGDDAVCAMGITAILYLQERALMGILVALEQGKSRCTDRAGLR
jgi:hypothetical protein